jgi:hypothetical protein
MRPVQYRHYDPKLRSHRHRMGKKRIHRFGVGVGRYVPVFGLAPQHQISHAPARQQGLITSPAQRLDNLQGTGVYLFSVF